jgi:hypothetical protein
LVVVAPAAEVQLEDGRLMQTVLLAAQLVPPSSQDLLEILGVLEQEEH